MSTRSLSASDVATAGVDRRAASVSFRVENKAAAARKNDDHGEDEDETTPSVAAVSSSVITVHQNRDGEIAVDPTARWVWDSCPRLCEYLCESQVATTIRGKSVIELGAGTGLPGLVCSRLGAKSVTLTDLPSELDLLRLNVDENKRDGYGDAPVDVRACAWGKLDAFSGERFDVVIVSDVLYHQPHETMRALAETLKALVAKDGVVYFAYHFRENLLHDAYFFELIDEYFEEKRRTFSENSEADENIWLLEFIPKTKA